MAMEMTDRNPYTETVDFLEDVAIQFIIDRTSWYVVSRKSRQFVRSLNICNSQVGSVKDLVTKLTTCLEDVKTVSRVGNIVTLTVPRFKQRITVVVPDFNSIQSVLDVCKVTTIQSLHQHRSPALCPGVRQRRVPDVRHLRHRGVGRHAAVRRARYVASV